MKNKYCLFLVLLFLPSISHAAYFGGVNDMVTAISGLIKVGVGIAFALAMLAFFFGIARFLWNVDNAEQREQGKWVMIYSVVAIFVMVSIYGLVGFLQKALIPDYANVTPSTQNTGGSTGGSTCTTSWGTQEPCNSSSTGSGTYPFGNTADNSTGSASGNNSKTTNTSSDNCLDLGLFQACAGSVKNAFNGAVNGVSRLFTSRAQLDAQNSAAQTNTTSNSANTTSSNANSSPLPVDPSISNTGVTE